MKLQSGLVVVVLMVGVALNGLVAAPFPMASGNYTNSFSDISSWPAGLGGTANTASNWSAVAINALGTIPDGAKVTTSTATFSTGTGEGLQRGTGTLVLLAANSSDNTHAVAVDLLLDFTGRAAGTLSFDWTQVNDSTGNRVASLRVYTSTDGTTWTELPSAFVCVTNNYSPTEAGTQSSLALPASFNGNANARIRFYVYNGKGGSSGYRPKIAIDNVSVTSTGTSGGAAPVITGISPASIAATVGDTVAFTVTASGDAPVYYWFKETATMTNWISAATTATLTLSNVSLTDAANYQVVLSNATPPMATSAAVSLAVSIVATTNQAPVITNLFGTNSFCNTASEFSFVISDDATPVDHLTLSARSGNSSVVPNDAGHLYFTRDGSNCVLTVIPTTDRYGVAPISVTVSDGEKSATQSCALQVRPNADMLLNESFDYDTNGALVSVSGGLWKTHSGTAGQMKAGSGCATVSDVNGEDVNAPLIGQPYNAAAATALYSCFTLNYRALPSSAGTYFAHFKDSSSGFYDRVYASTLNAATGCFRLAIANRTDLAVEVAQDIPTNSNHQIVTRLSLADGVCTIWVDPTDESSPSVTDANSTGTPNAIVSYALRENSGEGTLTVDNLKVGQSFASVTGSAQIVPITNSLPLEFQFMDGQLILAWTNANFSLQMATNVAGPYVTLPDAVSPYTNLVTTNAAMFFRLRQ